MKAENERKCWICKQKEGTIELLIQECKVIDRNKKTAQKIIGYMDWKTINEESQSQKDGRRKYEITKCKGKNGCILVYYYIYFFDVSVFIMVVILVNEVSIQLTHIHFCYIITYLYNIDNKKDSNTFKIKQ